MCYVLIKNQYIKIKWVSANKKWYINKGYKFTKIWDYFYVKAEDLMPNSKYEVKIKCDYCGKEYVGQYSTYITGIKLNGKNACYDCKGNKAQETYMNKLGQDRYNAIKSRCDNLGYILLDNKEDIHTVTQTMHFICPEHGYQTLHIALFLNGSICRKCAIERNKKRRALHAQSIIEKQVSQYNNNILLNKEDYIGPTIPNLRILCGKCHEVFVTSKKTYLKNVRRNPDYACPTCNRKMLSEKLTLSPDKVEEYINAVNNNQLLNKNDYIGNGVSNLQIKCGLCGTVFTTSLSNYQFGKNMCGNCTAQMSHGEYEIKKVLDFHSIAYNQEYWFHNCRDKNPLPFDFYLPDYNMCIEYQGEQHYRPIDVFEGNEDFELRKYHDQIKRDYCKKCEIILIEIPYWEYKNINIILAEALDLTISDKICV